MNANKIWKYVAFSLDADGSLCQGIEEEILAPTREKARVVAWRRAVSNLLPDTNAIRMVSVDYVRDVSS
jgi:hypothetical protein